MVPPIAHVDNHYGGAEDVRDSAQVSKLANIGNKSTEAGLTGVSNVRMGYANNGVPTEMVESRPFLAEKQLVLSGQWWGNVGCLHAGWGQGCQVYSASEHRTAYVPPPLLTELLSRSLIVVSLPSIPVPFTEGPSAASPSLSIRYPLRLLALPLFNDHYHQQHDALSDSPCMPQSVPQGTPMS